MSKDMFRKHFGYDTAAASDESAVWPVGESLTVQSMAEDADINVLMRRYGITGKMPENPRVPSYGDFTGISDFRGALDAVSRAEEMFMEYPAEVRARFGNSPQALLEFVEDARNLEEARRLGLVNPAPVLAPVVPPQVPPAAVVAANVANAPPVK